jgi:hypothetical protein
MWIPVKDEQGNPVMSKNGVPVKKPWTMGVKVHMKDGSSWFHKFATKKAPASWTRTRPPTGSEKSSAKMSFPGTGEQSGEVKDESIQHRKLIRDCLAGKWPGRKLLDALNWGLDHAESWRAQ